MSLPSATALWPSATTVRWLRLSGVLQPRCLFRGSTVWLARPYKKPVNGGFVQRCNAISKTHSRDFTEVLDMEDAAEREALELEKDTWDNNIKERVDTVKSMLESMGDGEINSSAYDTAWVALIEDTHRSGSPQFPASIEWIANNQLPDGSWGDNLLFMAHDRLLNTLACVVALTYWNLHPDQCQKGISFFKENLCKLEQENEEHMLIGFEIVFPSLLDMAKRLNLEVPLDSPVLQEIYAKRDLKLKKIPNEIMHKVPTTLLHSLEGMEGLEWEHLLKLKCTNGSFLFSPSSTAFAFMNTKDDKCLQYLTKVVHKFNGGVPTTHPVDMFEHVWAVDRLQRLGISRYFQPQIRACVNYVSRYYTAKGISWGRDAIVEDIDDTSMAFRILRLHGHQVSDDVFLNFKKGDEFFGFPGQSSEAVTGINNLFLASQLAFPGEKTLVDAKRFSYKFLIEKQAANELFDKWIITKDLPGEVGYALDVPWYANLPRIEARFYIEHYGGEDDVWIGKTLYRMDYVNNNEYLELAKQDYNNCQALHRREWAAIQKWYGEKELENFGVSRKTLLRTYFVAAASIFEPERFRERLAWAKTAVLVDAISSQEATCDQRKAFVDHFLHSHINGRISDSNETRKGLVRILLGTLYDLSLDSLKVHSHNLRRAWEDWLVKWQEEGDMHEGEAELIVRIIMLSAGHFPSDELMSHPQYHTLMALTNTICYHLRLYHKQKVHDYESYNIDTDSLTTPQIESDMQQLVQLVLQNSSDGIDPAIKNILLTVAKSFYYTAYFPTRTINLHVAKVLFEKVE